MSSCSFHDRIMAMRAPAKRKLPPCERDGYPDSGDSSSSSNDCPHERCSAALCTESRTAKRPRTAAGAVSGDNFSSLSDELLVRILSFLDEKTLLGLSPTSRRFCRITADSQLWRPHYYRRFILPRAHKIPGFRSGGAARRSASKLRYSAGKSIWADGGWGRRGGFVTGAAAGTGAAGTAVSSPATVDWKRQYKLRHNWARGQCAVEEVQVHGGGGGGDGGDGGMEADAASVAEWQTLVKVVEGLAITVDSKTGLRAWDLRTRRLLSQTALDHNGTAAAPRPSCLAVDDSLLGSGVLDVAVGFEEGGFGIWRLDLESAHLSVLYRHAKGFFGGGLTAVAYSHPYVLAASALGLISLFSFDQPEAKLITSLKSHNTRSPLALSIRRSSASVVASIAYTFDAVNGWCIGIQNLDIKPSGIAIQPEIITSKLAYTLPTRTRAPAVDPVFFASSRPHLSPRPSPSIDNKAHEGPVRLCYSHPYLLATLPDNTLVLHLCTSTASSLSISPGLRLWGHTSGISDAEITPQGKAVSISTKGNEIRVWDLEGRVGGSSVEVRPRWPSDTRPEARSNENGTSRVAADTDDRKN